MLRGVQFVPFIGSLCLILGVSLLSCGEYIPLWKAEKRLPNYILSTENAPLEFAIQIDSVAPLIYAGLELEILYDTYTGRESLPLNLEILDEKGVSFLAPTLVDIPIRKGQSWLGYPLKKNKEYIITHMAVERIKLFPGSFTLRVVAKNTDLPFLPGIVEIRARLFRM